MATGVALLGSGEFDPWAAEVDRAMLERANGDGRVLVIPTASAPEGEEVFASWGHKGLAHYTSIGVEAEVIPIRTREDAERADLVAKLESASVAFFSGGNPYYLSQVLRDSTFLRVLRERLDDGLAYAGCSAGCACLTETTFDSDEQDFSQVLKPGLGLVRRAVLGPHWDMVDTWIPGARDFIVGSVPDGYAFVGIDEDTAVVGDGRSWSVLGRQEVHVRVDDRWSSYRAGDSFDLVLEGL